MNPNRRFFTKTFYHFLAGFAVILALAFTIFVVGAQFLNTTTAATPRLQNSHTN